MKIFTRWWRLLIFLDRTLLWIGVSAIALTSALLLGKITPQAIPIGVVGFVALAGLSNFLLVLPVLFRKISERQTAEKIEKIYPEFENRILSAMELESERSRHSEAFAVQLLRETEALLPTIETRKLFRSEWRKILRSFGFAGISSTFLVITILFLPASFGNFRTAMAQLLTEPQQLFFTKIEKLTPGNLTIRSTEKVDFSAKIVGGFTKSVSLHHRLENGNWQTIEMSEENGIDYRTEIQNITDPIEYYISTNNQKSDHFHIKVLHEPHIDQFQIRLDFPNYTGLSPQVLEKNTGDFEAPIGTFVKFNGVSNKSIERAKIVFEQSGELELQISESRKLNGIFQVKNSEKYHVKLFDREGLTNFSPVVHEILVMKDRPPRVEILEPGKDVVLDDFMILPITLNADDDYGIKKVRLHFQQADRDEKSKVLGIFPEERLNLLMEHSWDMSELGLFPGDEISYHVEAIDGDNLNGPNIGRSEIFKARVPSVEELLSETELEQSAELEELSSLMEHQSEAENAIEELIQKVRRQKNLTVRDRKSIEQLIATQEQMAEKVERQQETMAEISAKMAKKEIFDRELVEKYDQLQNLMAETLTAEQKEILRKLTDSLDRQKFSDSLKDLKSAKSEQEKLSQQLDRLISLYMRFMFQQKLASAIKLTENIEERQKQIGEEIKNGNRNGNRLSEREKKLKKSSGELRKKLKQLSDEMSKESDLKSFAQELDQIDSEFKEKTQLYKKIDRIISQFDDGDFSGASQSSQEIRNSLVKLREKLESLLSAMKGISIEAVMAEVRSMVEGGIYLSKIQEKVIASTDEIFKSGRRNYIDGEVRRLQKLAVKELQLAKGVKFIARKLRELEKKELALDPKIVWLMDSVGVQLKRSAKALGDRQPNLALPLQQESMKNLNLATSALIEVMKKLRQTQKQSNLTDLASMMEALQKLAGDQKSLNEMAKNLSQQFRQQGKTPALQELLSRLAQEQKIIREAMDRLAKMSEGMSEWLGALRKISEEMKAIETEMSRGNLDREVVERQQKILTRLLESSKSLQKRGKSRKRKGEVAKSQHRTKTISELDPELLSPIEKTISDLRSGKAEKIPPQYRRQIEQYFKALSRHVKR